MVQAKLAAQRAKVSLVLWLGVGLHLEAKQGEEPTKVRPGEEAVEMKPAMD